MAKKSVIPKVRKIANEYTAAKIDGYIVDAWTANLIVNVYDKLSGANKASLDAANICAVANVCLSLAA
jgi:hypothetical protein